MKAKSLLTFAAIAAVLIFARKRAQGVGKLSDNEVELDNILKGVERGWYTARPDILNGMYVVYLAGQKTDGETTEDVYPISKQTYDALLLRGIGALPRVKRRIYKEVSLAQSAGVDFSKKFDELTEDEIVTLETVGSDANWKQSKRAKESGKSYAESYYGSLKRAWNAVSGCEGVGTAYNVKDGDGNIVLTWIEDAAAHVEAEQSAEEARRSVEESERNIRKIRNRMKARRRKIDREGLMPAEQPQEPVTPVAPEVVEKKPKASKKQAERESRASFARAVFDHLADGSDPIKNLLNTTTRDGELAGDVFVREFANRTLKFKKRKGYPFDKFYTKQYGWNDSGGSVSEALEYLFTQWDARIKNEGFAREDINQIRRALLDKAQHMVVVTQQGEYIRGDERYNYLDDINFIIMARVTDHNTASEEDVVTIYPMWSYSSEVKAKANSIIRSRPSYQKNSLRETRSYRIVPVYEVNIDAISGIPND